MLNKKKVQPKGILHVTNEEPLVGLERFDPSARMAPFVEHYWAVRWVNQPKVLRETVPHPSVHLVFEPNGSNLHGIHQKRFSRWIEGTGWVLGVKFRPSGFRAFTKIELASLTNTVVPPSTIFGTSIQELQERVVEIATSEAAFEEIEHYLASCEPQSTLDIEVCNRMVMTISEDRSITQVEGMAEKFQTSVRSIQRLFAENVGVTPKWVIQRYRIMEAAERMRDPKFPVDYVGLAAELGYADQSHFIRDFKSFVGLTPAKYRDNLQGLAKKVHTADSTPGDGAPV